MQEEKVHIEKFDNFESDAYNLSENGIKIYLYPTLKRIKYNENGERVIFYE